MRRVASLAAVALAFVACAGDGGGPPEITEARLGQPTGPNAALYLTATSGGEADRLLGASTDAAASVELHETTIGDDGTMAMQAVEGADLPAGGELVLEPGSYHFMMIDADRMEVGDVIEVTISWEQAGDVIIEAEVVAPGETMGHGDMGDEGSGG